MLRRKRKYAPWRWNSSEKVPFRTEQRWKVKKIKFDTHFIESESEPGNISENNNVNENDDVSENEIVRETDEVGENDEDDGNEIKVGENSDYDGSEIEVSENSDDGAETDEVGENSDDDGTETDEVSENSDDDGTETDEVSENDEDEGAKTDDVSGSDEEVGASVEVSDIENFLYTSGEHNVFYEALIRILDMYIKHRLTHRALQDVLMLSNMLLHSTQASCYLPNTIYQLLKFLRNLVPPCDIIRHYFCTNCVRYLGVNKHALLCAYCTSKKPPGFFFEIDIVKNVRSLFEDPNFIFTLESEMRNKPSDKISDITSGSEYLRVNNQRDSYDITLILNTDGISLSKSSTSHCWPIMATVAELPNRLRDNFTIVIAVWNAEIKPNMNTFFTPVCKKLNILFQEGLSWKHPTSNRCIKSRIIAPLIVADAPARAQLQNILNFNGRFGCNICEFETKSYHNCEKGKKKRSYIFEDGDEIGELRCSKNIEENCEKAVVENRKHFKGVKPGISILSSLPYLDLGTFVFPEYMHSALLGIGKQFVSIWMKKKRCSPIKYYISAIDESLKRIKLPANLFHRLPRSINEYKKFKASEFLNWILYYSIPILSNILYDDYFRHWTLFVTSLYTLLKNEISIDELNATEKLLQMFVKNVGILYGNEQYTVSN